MTMICPICGQSTQHDAGARVVRCVHCHRAFQLEPKSMNIEQRTQCPSCGQIIPLHTELQRRAKQCVISHASSRVCERGTKSCEVSHSEQEGDPK
jgi:DNA-directed RNA polymerase subunit RPC12/RpoP